jgi:hypothetical protein
MIKFALVLLANLALVTKSTKVITDLAQTEQRENPGDNGRGRSPGKDRGGNGDRGNGSNNNNRIQSQILKQKARCTFGGRLRDSRGGDNDRGGSGAAGSISFSEPLGERSSDVIIDLFGLQSDSRYRASVYEFADSDGQCRNIGDIFTQGGFLGRFRTDGKGRAYKVLSDRKVTVTNPNSIIGRSCEISLTRLQKR